VSLAAHCRRHAETCLLQLLELKGICYSDESSSRIFKRFSLDDKYERIPFSHSTQIKGISMTTTTTATAAAHEIVS